MNLNELKQIISDFNTEHIGEMQVLITVLPKKKEVDIPLILKLSGHLWNVKPDRIVSRSRCEKDGTLFARYFMYAYLRELGVTLKKIAEITCKKDHSTICAGVNMHFTLMGYDSNNLS